MRKHPWSGNKADCRLGIPVVPQSPNMGEPFSREQRVWKKLWKSLWKSCWQVTAYFPLPEQARSNVPFPYTNRYTSGFSISLIFSFSISYPDTYPFPITLIVTKKQLITSEKKCMRHIHSGSPFSARSLSRSSRSSWASRLDFFACPAWDRLALMSSYRF